MKKEDIKNKKDKKIDSATNQDAELEKMYQAWIGGAKGVKTNVTNPMMTPEAIGMIVPTEKEEPYQNIEPVEAIVALPFDAKEGDELDLHAVVKGFDENGQAIIEIQKAFVK